MLKAGHNESAFNAIVDAYSEKLYWHVRRFLCNHDETNDLLQEIFIKIWKGLPYFRAESRIFTWLYRIATNEALNFLRKQKVKFLTEDEFVTEILVKEIDKDPYFNGDALQRELHKAIQKLPQKQKIVFNMRYFDEMRYEDIAAVTGTSVGALKASYHHAYNKIKAELEERLLYL